MSKYKCYSLNKVTGQATDEGWGEFAKHGPKKGMMSKMRKQTRKRKATQQFKERSMKCPVNVKIQPTSLEIRGVQVKSTVTYTHATRTAVMQV